MKVSGHIIDIYNRTIFTGSLVINNGKIESIEHHDNVPDQFILPGFIDAHIHIESSMVTPFEFARIALGHGTVATVSDPHEIANVCGKAGVDFMINNAKHAGMKFFFGAPSCVPATSFENAGATLDVDDVNNLLGKDDIWYLSEMMNWPGVLHDDPDVLMKINCALNHGKPVDGHAPGLKGIDARVYISKGISTDHECYTLEEAQNKLSFGMKIIIREGSAARNFEALHSLIGSNPDMVMFCSDDKHPDELLQGHINLLVKRSLLLGYDLFDVLKIACINPVLHYNLPVGTLKLGDPGDFIVINNTKDWNVTQTYINGEIKCENSKSLLKPYKSEVINKFACAEIKPDSLSFPNNQSSIPVIKAIDGALVTEKMWVAPKVSGDMNVADTDRDILKICVINRYKDSKPSVGFINNFGLKDCAIASTVAHDSHNIIVVGDNDELMCQAINLLIKSKGGLSAVSTTMEKHIPLPIGGLMSDKTVEEVGLAYSDISEFAKSKGCKLNAPFMTLSFMALLVIPKIKISDLGMFDAEKFEFY
ncbi:MAG: adenine deaminase [Saprospiraceae bacterium]|jgi:adenine deaminase|nr:adenine deaminase [Saprospiraceae bacterium]MBL0026130.1 adenine deaminase [Saprospiraceae bacterium]